MKGEVMKTFRQILEIVVFVIVAIVLVWAFRSFTAVTPSGNAVPTERLATQTTFEKLPEIVNSALAYTEKNLPSRGISPTVVLTRTITLKEFPDYGFGQVHFGGEEPPMFLVLLQGDFDTSNFGIGNKVSFNRASYVAYVFDLDTNSLVHISLSVDGKKFEKLLNSASESK